MLATPLSRSVSLLLGLAMTLAPAAFAAQDEEDAPGDASHAGTHEFHRNHLAVFLGITQGGEVHGGGKEDNPFTVGLDYERRFTPLLGVGFMADYLAGERREYVIGFPVIFHAGDARFYVAPGWERSTDSPRRPRENEFMVRLGFLYDFDVGPIILSPAASIDRVDGENLIVLGFTVGWGF